jgi:hypothetical protein
MLNNKELNSLINNVSEKLNCSPDTLKSNLQNGELSSVINKMNSKDAKTIQKILDNPKQREKILNSPQAQEIIKKLMS